MQSGHGFSSTDFSPVVDLAKTNHIPVLSHSKRETTNQDTKIGWKCEQLDRKIAKDFSAFETRSPVVVAAADDANHYECLLHHDPQTPDIVSTIARHAH